MEATFRELHDPSPEPVYIRAHHLLTSGNGIAELEVVLVLECPFVLICSGEEPVYDFTVVEPGIHAKGSRIECAWGE